MSSNIFISFIDTASSFSSSFIKALDSQKTAHVCYCAMNLNSIIKVCMGFSSLQVISQCTSSNKSGNEPGYVYGGACLMWLDMG